MNPQGIIIEGITGAGKSQTISALTNDAEFHNGWTPYDIYPEEETFGEFM